MEQLGIFFKDIIFTPISEMKGFQVFLLALLGIAALIIVRHAIKILFKALKIIFSLLYNIFSAKEHCKKIQCRYCGRTLDKCVCEKNRKAGNWKRLYRYRKETRAIKKARAAKKANG